MGTLDLTTFYSGLMGFQDVMCHPLVLTRCAKSTSPFIEDLGVLDARDDSQVPTDARLRQRPAGDAYCLMVAMLGRSLHDAWHDGLDR